MTPMGSEHNYGGQATLHGEGCVCENGDHHVSEQGNNPEFQNLAHLDVMCQNNLLKTQVMDMKELMEELQDKNNKLLPELNR